MSDALSYLSILVSSHIGDRRAPVRVVESLRGVRPTTGQTTSRRARCLLLLVSVSFPVLHPQSLGCGCGTGSARCSPLHGVRAMSGNLSVSCLLASLNYESEVLRYRQTALPPLAQRSWMGDVSHSVRGSHVRPGGLQAQDSGSSSQQPAEKIVDKTRTMDKDWDWIRPSISAALCRNHRSRARRRGQQLHRVPTRMPATHQLACRLPFPEFEGSRPRTGDLSENLASGFLRLFFFALPSRALAA